MVKKTTLSLDEVKHVAQLANLQLTPEELKKFQKQLSQIIEYVGKLSEVDTMGVESTSQVTGQENVFREDETKPSLDRKKVLANASKKTEQFFKVKAIFE